MGLDMYLTKKTYVKNWEHNGPEGQHEISIKKGAQTRTDIKTERISYIIEEVAYWRKFNALHGWFVNECADGVDECQEIYVPVEKLREILGILKQVNTLLENSTLVEKMVHDTWRNEEALVQVYDCEDQVMELLPPSQGCFFGSYDISKWYKNDVEETVEVLENILNEECSSCDFYYQASW